MAAQARASVGSSTTLAVACASKVWCTVLAYEGARGSLEDPRDGWNPGGNGATGAKLRGREGTPPSRAWSHVTSPHPISEETRVGASWLPFPGKDLANGRSMCPRVLHVWRSGCMVEEEGEQVCNGHHRPMPGWNTLPAASMARNGANKCPSAMWWRTRRGVIPKYNIKVSSSRKQFKNA